MLGIPARSSRAGYSATAYSVCLASLNAIRIFKECKARKVKWYFSKQDRFFPKKVYGENMTKEKALEIVKTAEAEYDQDKENHFGLAYHIRMIVNWSYYYNHTYECNAWQRFHEGMWADETCSSEEIADILTRKINEMENLLFKYGR